MIFTAEYTHEKHRGMLTASAPSREMALVGFKINVRGMKGKNKTLHEDTIKAHDTNAEAAAFNDEFRKRMNRPAATDDNLAALADKIYEKPPEPDEDDGDE